jgi:hypothetical protein
VLKRRNDIISFRFDTLQVVVAETDKLPKTQIGDFSFAGFATRVKIQDSQLSLLKYSLPLFSSSGCPRCPIEHVWN